MVTAGSPLDLAALALIAVSNLLALCLPRHARSPIIRAVHIAAAITAVTLIAVDLTTDPGGKEIRIAVLLAILQAMTWHFHLANLRGQTPAMIRWFMDWRLAKERGQRLLPLTDLRAEYAQTVLDDAGRDPALDAILDDLSGEVAKLAQEMRPRKGYVDEIRVLTIFANEYVRLLSDPDRPSSSPMYRDYSTDMLMLAAVCRRADQMQAQR